MDLNLYCHSGKSGNITVGFLNGLDGGDRLMLQGPLARDEECRKEERKESKKVVRLLDAVNAAVNTWPNPSNRQP